MRRYSAGFLTLKLAIIHFSFQCGTPARVGVPRKLVNEIHGFLAKSLGLSFAVRAPGDNEAKPAGQPPIAGLANRDANVSLLFYQDGSGRLVIALLLCSCNSSLIT